jgi:hypothetical protein
MLFLKGDFEKEISDLNEKLKQAGEEKSETETKLTTVEVEFEDFKNTMKRCLGNERKKKKIVFFSS